MATHTVDSSDLPKGPFASRAHLTARSLEWIHEATLQFIDNEYGRGELLREAAYFFAYSLEETPSANPEQLFRLGFFPWVEAAWELDAALTHALAASYKATFDCLRRALELSVVAAFFLRPDADEEDAKEWLRSDAPTPFFSRALKRLRETPRWQFVAAHSDWPESLKALFQRLSDVIHVRGVANAARTVQPFDWVINGHHVRRFDRGACRAALDAILETTGHIAAVVTLTNPALVIGLPLDEKFGLNPPASGVLNDVQAERLRSLLPSGLASVFERLASEDPDSRAVIDWIRRKADLTEAQLEEQVRRFREQFPEGGEGSS